MSEIFSGLAVAILGVAATLISTQGRQLALRIFGDEKLGKFAANALTLALARGVRVLEAEIDEDGWQPDDLVEASREAGKVIMGAAMSPDAIDMYLNELPDWLKGLAFGSKDDLAIKADERNVEALEAQLAGAGRSLLKEAPDVKVTLADAWFKQSRSRKQ